MILNITALPGDGVGPEVVDEGLRVLDVVAKTFGHELRVTRKNVGGAALLASKDPLPADTLQACFSSNAVLLGAVGGPSFDEFPRHLRPESGLLRLRRELGVFANLRPALLFPALEDCSPVRPEIVRGTDMVIVRELLGGIYFGEPRNTTGDPGSRVAVDTMRYSEAEIERIARVAFELARTRRRKLLSVDKANVLDCSRLWREVVTRTAADYSDVKLSHQYVDSAAMILASRPAEFDVILTENMFGDILSDQAGGIVGSLGMLASASIGGAVALYEPIHGSAPDIAGRGIANPLATILSLSMMLRHSFKLPAEAAAIERAVSRVLENGHRTRDLVRSGQKHISTVEMGKLVAETVKETSPQSVAS
ncbi:MAG TPA: 3-isopropylmalate dehydrogenase [Terriglobales bacterium]|jgi:3-isopropylmalate dehydrogenase